MFKLAPGVLTSFSAARGVAYEIGLISYHAVKRLNVSVSLVVKHVDVNGTKLPLILFWGRGRSTAEFELAEKKNIG